MLHRVQLVPDYLYTMGELGSVTGGNTGPLVMLKQGRPQGLIEGAWRLGAVGGGGGCWATSTKEEAFCLCLRVRWRTPRVLWTSPGGSPSGHVL